MALASLPAMRARSRPGMAMAAMMPISATPPKAATIAMATIATPWFESRDTSVRSSGVIAAGGRPENRSATPGRVR